MTTRIQPITRAMANAFIAQHHRHHPPVHGFKFGVAIVDETETVRGVAIGARPISRGYDPLVTLEVVRVATDGIPNGCSRLYGSIRRAAKALGYRQLLTYTLASECGVSLRASGWAFSGVAKGKSWNVPSRPRVDRAPICDKYRWVIQL